MRRKAAGRPRRIRTVARTATLVLALGAPVLFGDPAAAQVQATKHNTLLWIRGACDSSLTEFGRKEIARRGKTVGEVCLCTANGMWRRFPSVRFWAQETPLYDRKRIEEAFPEVLAACIEE